MTARDFYYDRSRGIKLTARYEHVVDEVWYKVCKLHGRAHPHLICTDYTFNHTLVRYMNQAYHALVAAGHKPVTLSQWADAFEIFDGIMTERAEQARV